jgi:hypothetical protein
MTRDRERLIDVLDVMKFICREFWLEMFRKPIDKLQTNNRVRTVWSALGPRRGDTRWLSLARANFAAQTPFPTPAARRRVGCIRAYGRGVPVDALHVGRICGGHQATDA